MVILLAFGAAVCTIGCGTRILTEAT
jgi:hypothetical protein